GKVAASEGRRLAKDEVAPRVKDTSARVSTAVQDRYEKAAPAVAGGLGAVGATLADLVASAQDTAQTVGKDVQDKAAAVRKDAEKKAAQARKDAAKAAKKSRKRGAKKAVALKKDARGTKKQAAKKAEGAQALFAAKASDAKDAAAAGGLTAAGLLATAVAALQDRSQELAPQVKDRLEQASQYAQDRRAEYAPQAAAALAGAAGRAERTAHDVEVPASVEQLLIKLTGDKKAVKHLRKNAAGYAKRTRKDLQRQARAESRSGRGWIVAGMAAAAAGAGVAVWKLTKPVQDPWTAPVPGPITANIPVVQQDGVVNPYAKQEQAVAEARLAGRTGQGPTVVVQQGPGAR
ncbi:hypothetical protein, partial [Micrococcus sp.]|uniref:hypothetical protein n=1 Tax=Micrococcus sp. TaxID=1271 RepID=UPI0026DA729B